MRLLISGKQIASSDRVNCPKCGKHPNVKIYVYTRYDRIAVTCQTCGKRLVFGTSTHLENCADKPDKESAVW
jgi:transcription elongation factor Elf1